MPAASLPLTEERKASVDLQRQWREEEKRKILEEPRVTLCLEENQATMKMPGGLIRAACCAW